MKQLRTSMVVFGLAAAALHAQFHVVGYFPDWAGSVDDIQYDKLTCINYSFILPSNGSGGLTGTDGNELERLVSLAHEQGVAVCIAVGGWNDGNDGNFETLAAGASSRTSFVNNLMDFVRRYNLDGVDIDWEYPDQGQSGENYEAMMGELGDALHGEGKRLTAAVVGGGDWAGQGIREGVFDIVDYLNIMSYDGGGQNHSSYDMAVDNLDYWLGRGLPPEKAVLGVPFYGRDPYVSYSGLVAQDPDAPNKDNVGNVYYNGMQTMRDKTLLALEKGGGIMFWELSMDTFDETSLLGVIDRTIRESGVVPGDGETGVIGAHLLSRHSQIFVPSGPILRADNGRLEFFQDGAVYSLDGKKNVLMSLFP